MCCCSCIKKLCVKLTYIILIAVVFGVGLMFSFDIYASSAVLTKSHYQDAAPITRATGNTEVTAKSSLLGVPYQKMKYNPLTKCINTEDSADDMLATFYIADDWFTVWGTTVKDGKTVEEELQVACAEDLLVDDHYVYEITMITSWCGLAAAVILILCVLFCCSDWCRCCCCKEKMSDETVRLIYA